MARVTLGYAWEGHQPDTTLELDEVTARRLLREGKARLAPDEAPPPIDLDHATVAEMREHARRHGIVLAPSARKRADIVDAIRAADQQ